MRSLKHRQKETTPDFILEKAKKGDITFPHHRPHDVVDDCITCHKWLGQKTDAIYFDKNYYKLAGYDPNEFSHKYERWRNRACI